MQPTHTFRRLSLTGWRQFEKADIVFHDRLTILTGSNGAGKSSLLNILAPHLGVSRPYLGVPSKIDGVVSFLSGVFRSTKFLDLFKRTSDQSYDVCGQLIYSNDQSATILVPKSSEVSYSVELRGQQQVLGFHMPSHRILPNYQQVPNISFSGVRPEDSFHRLINQTYAVYYNGHNSGSVLFELKQILASWAAIGEGNSVMESSPDQLHAYRGFVEVLKLVMPKEIGFRGLKIQPPDILFDTDSGAFLIDAASGGLLTLIEIAALIYCCTLREDVRGKRFVVTFDEPENHLHPALQRSLLPTLVRVFPQVQFIVATHSPFMVNSMQESNVYVLRYVDSEEQQISPVNFARRRVETVLLDQVNKAGTAGEILREVLGVPVTLPEWVENKVEAIISSYAEVPITPDVIEGIRADVVRAGLEELFTEVLSRIGSRR